MHEGKIKCEGERRKKLREAMRGKKLRRRIKG